MAQLLQTSLEEAGYSVATATDGLAGLATIRGHDFDLIILDRMLPTLDGLEVCRRIRSTGNPVPILMLTAKDKIQDRIDGLDAGASDYLTKPFALAELLARVRAQLRQRQDLVKQRLQVADLVLDLKTRRVYRASVLLDLSTKEFGLLKYLMTRSGQVVSRTEICQQVWDIHFDTASNIIDVHINRLRKKVDANSEAKLIHTVRGLGYQIKAP